MLDRFTNRWRLIELSNPIRRQWSTLAVAYFLPAIIYLFMDLCMINDLMKNWDFDIFVGVSLDLFFVFLIGFCFCFDWIRFVMMVVMFQIWMLKRSDGIGRFCPAILSRAVSEQFQSNFRAISEQLQSNFRAISEQLQSNFRAISEQFQSNFRANSEQFQLIILVLGRFLSGFLRDSWRIPKNVRRMRMMLHDSPGWLKIIKDYYRLLQIIKDFSGWVEEKGRWSWTPMQSIKFHAASRRFIKQSSRDEIMAPLESIPINSQNIPFDLIDWFNLDLVDVWPSWGYGTATLQSILIELSESGNGDAALRSTLEP